MFFNFDNLDRDFTVTLDMDTPIDIKKLWILPCDCAYDNEPKLEPGVREDSTYVVHVDEDGYATPIMSKITDVKVVKDRVTIVTFADGTQEKAVCAEGDTFSIENGITICLMKKMLADSCIEGTGTSIYNNLIRYAMKKVGTAKKKEEEAKKQDKEVKAARKRAHDEASDANKRNRQYWIDVFADAMKAAFGSDKAQTWIDHNQISLFSDDRK